MEHLDYKFPYRWFVELTTDDPVYPTVFTKLLVAEKHPGAKVDYPMIQGEIGYVMKSKSRVRLHADEQVRGLRQDFRR